MPNDKTIPTSVTFEYGENKSETVVSNWPDFTTVESVTLRKTSLSENYFLGDKITYIIDIKNHSSIPIFNVEVKEDMGKSNSDKYSPLKYKNNFIYYINGNITELPEPKIYSDKIIFEIDIIPALSNATVIYSAEVTENAPMEEKSSITNSSYLIIPSTGNTLTASHTVNIKEIADIKTIKQIKNLFSGGVTYSIFIYNYGNIPAKNIVIKDKIENASSNLKIKIGSKILSSSDYSLSSNDLQIPSRESKYSISVPEAKFIKDKVSGKLSTVPGVIEVTIDSKT